MSRTSYRRPVAAIAAFCLALTGCEVGPDYHRPAVETPPAFSATGLWAVGTPENEIPRGQWWRLFGDPELDGLESQVTAANPSIQAAFARVQEAEAIARVSSAALLPNVSADLAPGRQRFSGNRQLPPGAGRAGYTTNTIDLPLQLSYEIDLFGQLRRALEAARATAQAQADAYQSLMLSLQADAAQDYFTLRGLIEERSYLEHNVSGRRQELDLVRDRQHAGASDNLDVYRAQTELDAVLSTEIDVDRQIEQMQHALAILAGRPPEGYMVAAKPTSSAPPAVPVGLPSELLQRRPDVAQAERNLAAANATIGVTKAAFFPTVSLTAFGGFNSTAFNSLLSSSSREWAIAPFVTVPIFQGGRNWANYQRAKAAYSEAVANYREQVLVAFRDVEDSLSALRYLTRQDDVLQDGVTAAQKATDLSNLRYKQGVADYFEVIDAERSLLEDEIQYSQTRAQRFISTVTLIRSLGGGWR